MPPSRQLVRLADGASQTADSGGRIAKRRLLCDTRPQLPGCALFRRGHPVEKRLETWAGRSLVIVTWEQLVQSGLYPTAMDRLVEIVEMENKPELEAWIGLGDLDPPSPTHGQDVPELRVLVPIHHHPHLVVFFKRRYALSPSSVWREQFHMLDGPLRDRARNPAHRHRHDPRVLEPAAHISQVRRFGFGSFAVDVEVPLRLGDTRPAS